jgi:Flp pilus assembly protein TadG
MNRLDGSLRCDRRGVVALTFALGLVPLLLGVGAGVDIARGVQVKRVLQAAVDAAALAGASAYANGDSSGTASTVASNYFTLSGLPLPDGAPTPTTTVSTSQQTSNGSVSGYTVTVSATTQMPTTFMSLLISAVPVTATATAVNPISQVTLTGSGILDNFKSSACDLNTIYYYLTSDNNTIPNPNTFTASQAVGTNGLSVNPTVSFTITSTQKIGFALKNVTGGICGYGANQYGSAQGTTNWYFTTAWPPSNNPYNSATLQAVTTNNSFYTTTTSTPNMVLTPPVGGGGFSTPPTYPTVTCQQIGTQYINYYWNDMGGNPDDLDYNDMEYSLNCTPVGGNGNQSGTVASIQPVYLSQ